MTVASGDRLRTSSIRLIEILVVCTGNTCRSPMAAALLSRRFDDTGVQAVVSSTGTLFDGRPATDYGVAVMADRGSTRRGTAPASSGPRW